MAMSECKKITQDITISVYDKPKNWHERFPLSFTKTCPVDRQVFKISENTLEELNILKQKVKIDFENKYPGKVVYIMDWVT